MDQLIIRGEKEEDYRRVEEITREAFWNLYMPGCDEHYLVHLIRKSADFMPSLSFVAEWHGEVIGSIFLTKSYILDRQGNRYDTITFGPVSVLPEWHNQGVGTALIEYVKEMAARQGHRAILIYGYPDYYQQLGFKQAKEFDICNPEQKYPFAHLVLELYDGALNGISGIAYQSDLFHIDEQEALAYDALFEPKIKAVMPSQQTFAEAANLYL